MDGHLSLCLREKDCKTYLANSLFRLPLQIIRPFYLDDSGCATLFIINPCGGLVGGDALRMHVDLEERAHLLLTTQSATKVYKTLGHPASQKMVFNLKEGAVLEFLPDHVIPFAGSSFVQEIEINMEKKSVAIIVDSFASGRTARGERFQFLKYQNKIEARYIGRTFLLERMLITKNSADLSDVGIMEGNDYLASFYILTDSVSSHEGLVDMINSELEKFEDLTGSVSFLSEKGLLIRILSKTAFSLNDAILKTWALVHQEILGQKAPSLRKY
jgi:urease accessory protein